MSSSVSELKERHAAAIETVNSLRERLKQKRQQLLDVDGAVFVFMLLLFFFVIFVWFLDLRLILICNLLLFGSCWVLEVAGSGSGQLWSDRSSLL